MHNPENRKNFLQSTNTIFQIWLRVKYSARLARKVYATYVTLVDSYQSKIQNCTNHSHRLSYQVYSVRQANNGCVRTSFFLPYHSPSPILTCQPLHGNHFLTRPVISTCSSQLSVSSSSKSFSLTTVPALQATTT